MRDPWVIGSFRGGGTEREQIIKKKSARIPTKNITRSL